MLRPPRRGLTWRLGTIVLLVAILVGFIAHRQVTRVVDDWDGYWNDLVAEIGVELEDELDRRQADGEAASDALAALWNDAGPAIRVDDVRSIRAQSRASALALYDRNGSLVVWDGEHRGIVPVDVKRGEPRHAYRDLPLFGYLYLTSSAEDGSVAVAAYLLRSALPEGLGAEARDFVGRFFEERGERIRVTADDPGIAGVMWDLELDDDRLLSLVLEQPDRLDRADEIMDAWTVRVAILLGLAWLLLAIGGPQRAAGAATSSVGLMVLAAWLPFDQLGVLGDTFDPAFFVLPGPVPVTLGRFAMLCVTAFTLIAVLPRPGVRLPPAVAGAIAGLLFPALLLWVEAGAGATSLAGARVDWIVYEVGVAALLSLAAGTVLAISRDGEGSSSALAAAVALGIALAAALAAWMSSTASQPAWASALWAAPIALAAWGVRAGGDWHRSALRWGVAVVLGTSAALPAVWGHRFEARLALGSERLVTLSTADQPELEDALIRFGYLADSLDAAGAIDVSIIYDGWLGSGLAELGYPVWLQVHRRDGSPGEVLRVGVEGGEPEPLGEILIEGWAMGGVQLFQPNHADARYILTTKLAGDDLVSAVAPAFPESSGRSALGPLLQGARQVAVEPITVLPLVPGDRRHPPEPTLIEGRNGWQVEIGLDMDEGRPYHAHYLVELPTAPLAVARASLLLVMNLGLFLAFWIVGRALLRDPTGRDMSLSGLVISFSTLR